MKKPKPQALAAMIGGGAVLVILVAWGITASTLAAQRTEAKSTSAGSSAKTPSPSNPSRSSTPSPSASRTPDVLPEPTASTPVAAPEPGTAKPPTAKPVTAPPPAPAPAPAPAPVPAPPVLPPPPAPVITPTVVSFTAENFGTAPKTIAQQCSEDPEHEMSIRIRWNTANTQSGISMRNKVSGAGIPPTDSTITGYSTQGYTHYVNFTCGQIVFVKMTFHSPTTQRQARLVVDKLGDRGWQYLN